MNSPKELVKQNSFDIVRDNGNHLIENNEFFKDLSDIMEDDKFSNFFKNISSIHPNQKLLLST